MGKATPAAPRPGGGRRSWHESRERPKEERRTRQAGQWFLTLAALGLTALLTTLLIPSCRSRTMLVTITAAAPDRLVVAPIAFAVEDTAAVRDVPHDEMAELLDKELTTLGRQWSALDMKRQDIAVVYVKAHGLSDQGKAYLLQNDFLRWTEVGRVDTGRVEVETVLQQLRDCPGQCKLLVLDCGHMSSDPRLGLLVNEFPRLVERDVRAVNDPNLWVLLSTSVMETAAIVPALGRSEFSAALVDGLRGAADLAAAGGNRNDKVSLDELYAYLWQRLEAELSATVGARQTPILLRGGQGLVQPGDIPSDVELTILDHPFAPPAKPDDAASETKPEGDQPAKPPSDPGQRDESPKKKGTAAATPPPHSTTSGRASLDSSPRGRQRRAMLDAPYTLTAFQTAVEKPAGAQPSPAAPSGKDAPADKPAADKPTPDKPAGEKPAAEKPAEAKPAGEKSPGEKPGGEKPAAEKPTAGKPAPDKPAADRPPTADAGSTPKPDPLELLLDGAWRLRDQLASRASPEKWSPVDFSPHLWRELNAQLLDFEARAQAGKAFGRDELMPSLGDLVRELRELDEFLRQPDLTPPSSPRESASVGVRLQQAWKRFRDDPRGRVAFRRESQVLQDSRAALRVYADGLFLAPYLVATHQRWAWRGVDDDVVADRAALQSWLEGLYRLGTQLSQLEGRPLEAVAGRQLQGLVEQTRQAQRQLLERLTARSVRAASLAVKETGPDEVTAPIVDCLATPLMAADVRHRLRERLRNQPAPLANVTPMNRASKRVSLSPTSEQWRGVAAQARLEWLLVRLVHAETAELMEKELLEIDRLTAAGGSAGEKELWDKYRLLGATLREFYVRLPDAVVRMSAGGAATSVTPAASAKNPWPLFLVDARDARNAERMLADSQTPTFVQLFILRPSLPPQITVTGPGEPVALDTVRWHPISFPVRAVLSRQALVSGALKFNAQQVRVRVAGMADELAPGKTFPLPLARDDDGYWSGIVTLEFLAMNTSGAAERIELEASAADAAPAHSVALSCQLPKPNEITLLAQRAQAVAGERTVGSNGVILRGFPNRATRFQLSLSNRSGQAKSVRVELAAVPTIRGGRWAPGRLFTRQGNLLPGVYAAVFDSTNRFTPAVRSVVATAADAPVVLPAGDTPVVVAFPSAPPPAAPPAAAAAAGGAATTAPPAPAPDVTGGLVCVITDVADSSQRWIKWIEMAPMAPSEYLKSEVGYEVGKGQIGLTFTPQRNRADGQPDLPDDIAQKPLVVTWESADEQVARSRRNDLGRFDGQTTQLGLFAEVPASTTRKPTLTVHVDGSPRAFLFEVPLTEGRKSVDLRPSRAKVHIDSLKLVGDPKDNRVFLFPERPPVGSPIIEKDEEKKVTRIQLPTGRPAAFRVPKVPIELTFHVDAPDDAFALDSETDQIEIRFDAQASAPRYFFADRQRAVRLAQAGPDGLSLEMDVHDYRLNLAPEGLTDGLFQLAARLQLANQPAADDREHSVTVVFDNTPPVIKVFRVSPNVGEPVPQGTPLKVELEVDDLSGAEKVEFQFLDKANQPKNVQVITGAALGTDLKRWILPVETKEIPPGDYRVKMEVTDKVGWSTSPEPVLVTIGAPKAAPKVGTLSGLVLKGNLPQPRFTVVLGGAGMQTKSGPNGEYNFKDVPLGKPFKLSAGGVFQNREHEGKVDVTLEENVTRLDIQVQPK